MVHKDSSLTLDEARRELIHDVRRWLAELRDRPRSTLSYGMLASASERTETLLRLRLEVARTVWPREVDKAIALYGEGRELNRLALGQCVRIAFLLDQAVGLARGRPAFDRTTRSTLTRILRRRNDVIHGRLSPKERLETSQAFLEDIHQLCGSSFLTT